ncbi:MAG: hypothetical protein JOZ90_10240 [Alphaproteobacteria bacterium]|nr:hypothetical protein [Alphaproteobacteria bacterium]MBV9370122.1 hypothetical protein [Alphaproteobacteria bacterium]MBV9901462.1 hypothetical protein [Alphaproteobacteria bacterium]
MGMSAFIAKALVAVMVMAPPAFAKTSNFRVIREAGKTLIAYQGTKYEIRRPLRPREEGISGGFTRGMKLLAFTAGLSNGDLGKPIAYECILWFRPSLDTSVYRECQTPGQATTITVRFETSLWKSLDAEMRRRYPADTSRLRAQRSVYLVGTGAALGRAWLGGRTPYLKVKGWMIVGHTSNDFDALEDIVEAARQTKQIFDGARALGLVP